MEVRRAKQCRALRLTISLLAVAALVNCDSGEPNTPPIAVVGPDMNVNIGELVQLNGTGSNDPDASGALEYSWTMISRPAGSVAVLARETTARPTFTADVVGEYVAQLIVSDGKDSSSPVHCTITAVNRPPVADAGPDMTMTVGQTVQLNGGGSSDPDPGQTLTYTWSWVYRPAGSTATLSNPTAVNPSFVADRKGMFVVRLVVHDGITASSPDDCEITVPNRPPTANAGADQQVAQGSIVPLDGSGSSDPDGDQLMYVWVMVERPTGSVAVLAGANMISPRFIADMSGDYLIDLTVHDREDSSAPDRVTVTAIACTPDNARPITVGSTTNGFLRSTDCRLNDGSYFDAYRFDLTTPTTVRIDLTSTAFNAFLMLGSDTAFIAWDDDSGGNQNARIVRPLAPGRYIILANSRWAGETGPYQLTLAAASGASLDANAAEPVQGKLGASRKQLPDLWRRGSR